MGYDQGEWIMHGISENDPYCLHSPEQLIDYINEVGFLPLFQNDIPGLSVEERTVPHHWWCDDPRHDPWIWREILSDSGKVAYGKFFGKKAGFVSLEWFPAFANYRRDGYDFEARWDDEKVGFRAKKLMDCFTRNTELYSFELKSKGGFGKGGEKNFEGTVTELQMQTYLVIRAFRQRLNKRGLPYGWPLAVYTTPEYRWGETYLESAYTEEPSESYLRICAHLKEIYPIISDRQLKEFLK